MGYPPVDPSVMENLDELTGQLLTVPKVKSQLLSTFSPKQLDNHSLIKIMETETFQSDFNRQLDKMKERNNVLNLEE